MRGQPEKGNLLEPITYYSFENVSKSVKFLTVIATCILHIHVKFHAD